MKRHPVCILLVFLMSIFVATPGIALPRVNVAADSPGGTIHWDVPWVDGVGGTWTNGIGAQVLPPTVERGTINHDIHIANDSEVIFGGSSEETTVVFMKIGALGTDGSNSGNLLTDITNPNGRLTITGGVMNVLTTTNFNIGDANPYAPAGWEDPIRGELYLEGGVLNSRTVWVGARRGNATHGGRTDGYFEQSGGTANIDGGMFIGAASSLDNKENVNGEAYLAGGSMTLTAGIWVGVLPLGGEGDWTEEQLLGRGKGILRIGSQANVATQGTLELRLNSRLIFELDSGLDFNPVQVSTLGFNSMANLEIDASALSLFEGENSIALINFSTLGNIPDEDNISITGLDPRYTAELEFTGNQLLLHLVGEEDEEEEVEGFWLGYEIIENEDGEEWVETDNWMGPLFINHAPWVWSTKLTTWVWVSTEQHSELAGWVWAFDGQWNLEMDQSVEPDWLFIPILDTWSWVIPEGDGGWYWIIKHTDSED